MGKTDDARAALLKGDVATRTAAARALARDGRFADVEALVDRAAHDKSPSLRLYAAAAAADILARRRGAAGQKKLTKAQRAQVHDLLRPIDPGVNPGLLMLWSAVADKTALDRLGRMLRDPRNGVRAGAAMAVRRMALSAAAATDKSIPKAVHGWIGTGRLPPDALLELGRLIGQAGWTQLAADLGPISGAGRPHAGVVAEARDRLAARAQPEAWAGLWCSHGSDVLLPSASRTCVDWLAIEGGSAWRMDGTAAPLTLDPAQLDGSAARLVWAPRLGDEEDGCAIQWGGHTFWGASGPALAKQLDALASGLAERPEVALAAAGWLSKVEGVVAPRVRVRLLVEGGAIAEAAAALEPLLAAAKPRPELFLWLAHVRRAEGDVGAAREAAQTFLERAAKRAPLRARAEALVADLG